MKKLMFLTLASILFVGSMFAQEVQDGSMSRNRGPVNREQRMKMRVERFNQQLNLSDEQKQKIEAVFTEEESQRSKMREQQTGDREQMRSGFEKMRTERDAKMKEILTSDQFAKYTEMNRNMGQRGGSVSSDQKEQVKEEASKLKSEKNKKKEDKLKKASEEAK